MLLRASGSVPICIRCRLRLQLRLARQSHHRPFLSIQQVSQFSSSSSRRQAVDNAPADPIRRGGRPAWNNGESTRAPDRKRRYPPGRIRGKKGKELREGSASLPIDSLGEPSKIIVLKDAGIKPLSGSGAEQSKTEEQLKSVVAVSRRHNASGRANLSQEEILREIEEQNSRSTPEQAEVNRQIEGLKPVANDDDARPSLSRDEFDSKARILLDGFTTAQLEHYVHTKRLDAEVRQADKPQEEAVKPETDTRGAISISSWKPGVSPINLPKKMAIVDRILRVHWQIDVLEEVESLGKLEVRVEDWQQLLLVAGGPSKLDQIRRHRRVKIFSHGSSDVIEITAPKDNAEYAAKDIDQSLRSHSRLLVDLNPFKPLVSPGEELSQPSLHKQDFALASKLSGAIFTWRSGRRGRPLLIRGLSPSNVEDGRRMLLSMLDLPTRNDGKLLATCATSHDGILHPPGRNSMALEYRDRRENIPRRWSLPVQRRSLEDSTQYSEDDISSLATEVRENVTNFVERVSPSVALLAGITPPPAAPVLTTSVAHPSAPETSTPETSEPKPSQSLYYWQSTPRTETSANIGQILHRAPTDDHSPTALINTPLSSLLTERRRSRVFCPMIPNFPALLNNLSATATNIDATTDAHLLFRFIASPWDHVQENEGLNALTAFPELHVRFAIPKGAGQDQARFEGMGLFLGQGYRDVAIPDGSVDLRFAKREMLWADAEMVGQSLAMAKFVKEIQDALAGQGQLRAPASVTVNIPTWTVKGAGSTTSTKTHKAKSKEDRRRQWEAGELTEVTYLWLGVEWRETVKMGFEGHELTYMAVEGGKLGGRRGEMRLMLGEDTKGEDAAREFVDAAFRLAGRVNGRTSATAPDEVDGEQ